jgi:RNA polymerase sigma-70 factor (ECF subfamily)
LDRWRQGDDSARWELIGHAYERLRLLARKLLHQDFPRLDDRHETGSVLHEAVLRLRHALEQARPATVQGFFALASKKTREVLLDLARRERPAPAAPPAEAADPMDDPARLAQWTEFHRKVDELPEAERRVVDLYWYQGVTQAEVGRALGLTQKEVSRLWLKATGKLPDCLP